MTTCVAVWKKDSVAVATDRRASMDGDLYYTHGMDKCKRVASWLAIATAGGSAVLKVLDEWALTETPTDGDSARKAIQMSADALWEEMEWGRDEGEDSPPVSVLCATPWGIYIVTGGGSVWPVGIDDGSEVAFASIGSGSLYALGALGAMTTSDLTAQELARKAIEVATKFDPGTGNGIRSVLLESAG